MSLLRKRVRKIDVVFDFIGELDLPIANQPITVTDGFNEKNRVTETITR